MEAKGGAAPNVALEALSFFVDVDANTKLL
jgi:hypothetical protein